MYRKEKDSFVFKKALFLFTILIIVLNFAFLLLIYFLINKFFIEVSYNFFIGISFCISAILYFYLQKTKHKR